MRKFIAMELIFVTLLSVGGVTIVHGSKYTLQNELNNFTKSVGVQSVQYTGDMDKLENDLMSSLHRQINDLINSIPSEEIDAMYEMMEVIG